MTETPRRTLFTLPRAELPFALWMSFYFFLVIATFWILKPIKKALFIRFYDESGFDALGWELNAADGELIAKVGRRSAAARGTRSSSSPAGSAPRSIACPCPPR